MCGITGWIDWELDLTQQERIIDKMTETLAPRGPDDSGKWLSTHAAFGHRRLSVVDPAGGAQPMVRERGGKTYVVTYNGELYNTPELRRELESRGYVFSTNCDTEVLLVSYMEWGPQCVERFNGIYAFGIWDDAQETFFMARDRMGVKPLFYTVRGKSLIFGSELKTILAHPAVRPVVGEEGLAEVLIMGPARTPGHGVYEDVYEVRPGYSVLYNRNGIRHIKYWTLRSLPHHDDLETTTATVRHLVEDSIERQLVADVPVCTFLSGGLDSSTITAIAAREFVKRGLGTLRTFSIDYKDNDRYFKASEFQPNADAPWIERVVRHLGTRQKVVMVDIPQLVGTLEEATVARDLPGMADVDSSLLYFCREVKKEATVALSGECADEVFGGYPWFHNAEALLADSFPWVRSLEERIKLFKPGLFKSFQPQEYIVQRYRETIAEVPRLEGEDPLKAKRREMFYLNLNWFMSTLLDRKDRMSMATGLEVRVPFCDHRLVEYVWNIPWEMKTVDGRAKGILRRALQGLLPHDVLERHKSPYPKTHNPAYTEAVRSALQKILEDPASPLLQVINVPFIRKIMESSEEIFDRPWFGQLMKGPQLFAYLIQVNTWLKTYKVEITC